MAFMRDEQVLSLTLKSIKIGAAGTPPLPTKAAVDAAATAKQQKQAERAAALKAAAAKRAEGAPAGAPASTWLPDEDFDNLSKPEKAKKHSEWITKKELAAATKAAMQKIPE